MVERITWRLDEWSGESDKRRRARGLEPLPAMTDEEIAAAVKYLREKNYPQPEDCPLKDKTSSPCPGWRPACSMGVCHVATRLAGDF